MRMGGLCHALFIDAVKRVQAVSQQPSTRPRLNVHYTYTSCALASTTVRSIRFMNLVSFFVTDTTVQRSLFFFFSIR